jgi:glycosyltransferase involved in cell wall biosynthesis
MRNKFSIAMCTYNGARHLQEQLDSIAAQSRPPDELVVCDDGSTDSTQMIVRNFAATVPFAVQFHINEQNLGSTKNFERAISLCRGDLIALSDQDDVWFPGKLAQLEAEFDRAPNVGLIFTDAEVIHEDTRPAGFTLWEKLPLGPHERQRLRSGKAVDELLEGATVTGATMAFRATFKELVLPIPDDLMIIHDGWIAILVAAVSDVLPFATLLIRYRQHSGQQIGAVERKGPRPSQLLGPGSARDALQRENPYNDVLAVARSVSRRLRDRSDAFDSSQAMTRLEARITHLEARSSMPRGRLLRVRRVLRELITLRYHIYSKGLQSAVKDLWLEQ